MEHHRRGLRPLLKNDELLAAVEANHRTAPIDAKRRAMLDYVDKLTVSPATVTKVDVDGLRTVGFSDRDILDIVEVCSYYAYVNRIADGLGVPTERWVDF